MSRDFIYIHDLIDGIVKATFIKTEHHIFNIGSGVGTTLTKLLELIRMVTEADPRVIHTGNRPFDVSELVLDIKRAQRELGWAPQTPFLQGAYATWHAMLVDNEQHKKAGV